MVRLARVLLSRDFFEIARRLLSQPFETSIQSVVKPKSSSSCTTIFLD